MLINEAYFIGTSNHIPNIEGCIKNDFFEEFMKRTSEEALCLVLGPCLVKELKEHLKDDNLTLKDTAPEHIKNLVNGFYYDKKASCGCSSMCSCSSIGHCNKTNWKGLINEYSESLIADYVYHQWMLRPDSVCCCDSKGCDHDTKKKHKRIDAWNRFVSKVQECSGCSASLYRFLKDHSKDFKTHQGNCLVYQTYFNI